MRKYFFVLIVGLIALTYLTCDYFDRSTANALRIVEINDSDPLIVDVRDWYTYLDEDSTLQTDYAVKDWIVPITVTYTETGIGLPTYPSTYTAKINKYTVTFENTKVLIDGVNYTWRLGSVSGATNIVVQSDPEGRSTVSANLKVIPKEWIEARIDTLLIGCMVKGNIILEGFEELNGNSVADTGSFTIDFGEYWDDPTKIGQ